MCTWTPIKRPLEYELQLRHFVRWRLRVWRERDWDPIFFIYIPQTEANTTNSFLLCSQRKILTSFMYEAQTVSLHLILQESSHDFFTRTIRWNRFFPTHIVWRLLVFYFVQFPEWSKLIFQTPPRWTTVSWWSTTGVAQPPPIDYR